MDVLCLAYGIPGFGIRDLGSGNGGGWKIGQILVWSAAFRLEARKHWPGWRPANPHGAEDSRLTPGVVVR